MGACDGWYDGCLAESDGDAGEKETNWTERSCTSGARSEAYGTSAVERWTSSIREMQHR